jgi:ABC-type dipeptide/oligopeptide/nickel transport system permease subunit
MLEQAEPGADVSTPEVVAIDDFTDDPGPGRPGRRLGPWFWLAVAFLTVLLLSALFADWLPLNPYDKTFAGRSRQGPNWDFPFGNDNIGQDIFSRTIYGARVSLIVAGLATCIGIFFGSIVGLVAGYYRRTVDSVLTSVVDLLLAFPALVLALAIIIFFDNEGTNRRFWLTVTLGLLSIAPIARIVRASVLTFSNREFVQAAEVLGARNGRIMFKEVLPNVVPVIISYSLVFMAILVVVESAIGFLGLSVPPPTPTWGDMISKGRNELEVAAHIALFPAFVLFLTVLSLNYIGDKLREYFDVRQSIL